MNDRKQLIIGFIVVIFLWGFIPNTYSQVYGKLNHLRPTGVAGYVYKTTLGLEAGSIDDFETFSRSRFFVNLGFFRPRLDGFNMVTYYSEGNDFTVIPRIDRHPFNLRFYGGYGIDFMFFETEYFIPYIGFDVGGGMELKATQTGSSEEIGGYILLGGRARIGIEKEFNNLSLMLEWNSGISINDEKGIFLMNEIGLGIKF